MLDRGYFLDLEKYPRSRNFYLESRTNTSEFNLISNIFFFFFF